jgi:ABC-2 type transport system permease protein
VSPVQAAMVVARREFTERIRTRAFQISIATTLVIIGAVAVLAGVLGDDGPKTYKVGAQGPEAVAIATSAKASAPRFDAAVEVRRFTSPGQARAAVTDESVDAAIAGGTLLTGDDPPDELEQLLEGAARQVRAGEALRSEGVSGSDARRVLDPRRCARAHSRAAQTTGTRAWRSPLRYCSTCS